MEDEEEGRKGMGPVVEEEDESRSKKDMQEKLSKLFSQPTDPWASSGGCLRQHETELWSRESSAQNVVINVATSQDL